MTDPAPWPLYSKFLHPKQIEKLAESDRRGETSEERMEKGTEEREEE